MKILGALIFVAGLFLFFGNILGFFRTFPGAGYITIAIGGFFYKQGASAE